MPRHRQSPDQNSAEETVVAPRRRRRSSQSEADSSHAERAAKLRVSGGDVSAKFSSRRQRVARRISMAGPLRVLAVCAAFMVSVLLLAVMSANYGQYRQYDTQAEAKAIQLRALQSQHGDMKRRLAFLQLPKGREQVLLKNGYLRPGDRILLFPNEKGSPQENAEEQTSTLAPEPAASSEVVGSAEGSTLETGNAWNRASRTLARWWDNARRASGSQSADKDVPASAPVDTEARP